MARIAKKSRYRGLGTLRYRQYPDGAIFGQRPDRYDRVFRRRYTSYGEMRGTFTHVVKEGDTLLTLALQYFKDPHKWWIIADFNQDVAFYSLDLQPRTVLKIPPLTIAGRTLSAL